MPLGVGELILIGVVLTVSLAIVAVPVAVLVWFWNRNKRLAERVARLERQLGKEPAEPNA